MLDLSCREFPGTLFQNRARHIRGAYAFSLPILIEDLPARVAELANDLTPFSDAVNDVRDLRNVVDITVVVDTHLCRHPFALRHHGNMTGNDQARPTHGKIPVEVQYLL